VQFMCGMAYDQQTDRRLPTTYAWSPRGKLVVVRWETNFFSNSGFTPQKRCEVVSPKFDQAYRNGSLKYLTTGVEKGQSIICSANKLDGDCVTTLMTLRPEDKPAVLLQELSETLQGRPSGGTRNNSGEKQVYYKLNIDYFLSNAPVEGK
jgi:hypothetical protein